MTAANANFTDAQRAAIAELRDVLGGEFQHLVEWYAELDDDDRNAVLVLIGSLARGAIARAPGQSRAERNADRVPIGI